MWCKDIKLRNQYNLLKSLLQTKIETIMNPSCMTRKIIFLVKIKQKDFKMHLKTFSLMIMAHITNVQYFK